MNSINDRNDNKSVYLHGLNFYLYSQFVTNSQINAIMTSYFKVLETGSKINIKDN